MTAISIASLLRTMSAPRLNALFAQDADGAARWVYALAQEGVPPAQVCYGRLRLEGTGVPKDSAVALFWFRRAAEQGDVDAMNMVGRCLDNGWGTPENPAAAAVYYTRAAAAGHPWAQYNLAHLYLDGRGMPRDPIRAHEYYRRAADRGHERAMNLVARCLEEGWGTARDPHLAGEWYERSAQAGYFRGQYNWATVLLRSQRFAEAALWFERAAINGTAEVRRAVVDIVKDLARRGSRFGPFQDLDARFNSLSPSWYATNPSAHSSL